MNNKPTVIYIVYSKVRFHCATFDVKQAQQKAIYLNDFSKENESDEVFIIDKIPYLEPEPVEVMAVNPFGSIIKIDKKELN